MKVCPCGATEADTPFSRRQRFCNPCRVEQERARRRERGIVREFPWDGRCVTCGRMDAETEFYEDRRRECKACRRSSALAHYRADPERGKAYSRAYRRDNPDKVREQNRRYPRENRDRRRELNARRRARVAGAESERFDRVDIYERDGGRCHICGRAVPRDSFTLDHLIPIAAGGPNTRANVAVAHRSCNSRRGAGWLPAQLRLVG